jgi:hypothetical protein
MTAAQKAAREKFKKAVTDAQKLRKINPKLTQAQALKQAFAANKKVGAVKKKAAPKKAATKKAVEVSKMSKKQLQNALTKKLSDSGISKDFLKNNFVFEKLGSIKKKKPAPKKAASKRITDIHKDSKSHNVNIKVVSGVKKIGALYEFFDIKGLTDIDSLKKSYFKLAKVYHPDAGGTKEQFQRLQKEYEGLFKTIMSGSNLSANDIANEIELDENLRQAVDAIIGIPQLNVELIGKWIWVSGNTYPIRNELKNAGFMFAPVKKMWYYKGIESAGRGKLTIDEIRKKYGTQAIQKEGMKKIQGIGEYISPAKKKKFFLSLKKALKALDNRKDQKIIISGIINKIH